LVRLQEMGVAFCDREMRAWYLVPQTELLLLLQEALAADAAQRRLPSSREKLSTELSTGADWAEDSAVCAEDFSVCGEYFAGEAERAVEETAVSAGRGAEDSSAAVEVSSAAAEVSSRGREDSTASGPNLDSWLVDPDQEKDNKQLDYGNGRRRWRGESTDGGQERLAEWLVKGGVGPGSPKMGELLAAGLELETVKAHVLERLAWMAGRLPDTEDYRPGLLIYRLLNDHPPPPMRCELCLGLPDKLGLCACDYDQLIRR
jgi:hypothetical protein